MTASNKKPSELIGGGYDDFLKFKGRYRVVKGSRASKKSKTTALNLIYRMMKYPGANALVVRKVYRTLKDSCFTELKWAINQIGVAQFWEAKTAPLELIYHGGEKTTRIYFRGLDDPMKINSITVDNGVLCWLWIEEAYELLNEDDFNLLDESIRGEVLPPLFKQITLTFNPWNDKHWIKKRFFDKQDGDTLALTVNYKCNEWLDKEDFELFEKMRINNPRRYSVAGLGEWGVVEGLVYERWKEEEFNIKDLNTGQAVFGLDFGYTNDPTALFCGILQNKKLYVFDELYKRGLSNRAIYEEIKKLGYIKEKITADSAEPKSIDELKSYGVRVFGAKKGKDSVINGIQWIQDLEIIIHPRCVNFITEISNYSWSTDKFNNKLNIPVDDFNHLMDAMRYALEGYITRQKWLY